MTTTAPEPTTWTLPYTPSEVQLRAHGTPVVFLHPKAMGGVLIELMETPKGDH